MALVWAVERFHFYLYGRDTFELVTDHKALEIIFNPKSKPCARIERWVLRLQSYRFKVVYKPGKNNIADPLSRLIPKSVLGTEPRRTGDEYIQWLLSYAEPKAIKLLEIEQKSSESDVIKAVKEAKYNGVWDEKTIPFKAFEKELCFSRDILLRGTRIVIPENLRERVLQLAHEGHPGMAVMKRRLRCKVWWPKIDEQVEKYVKKCEGCTLVSAPSAPEPMKRSELPARPWEHLAIDFMGPLPSGHNLLVVVDYYSRFIEVEIMKKIDSTETIRRLETMFARFGAPVSMQTDNGPQFTSQEFSQFCENNNIQLKHTTPYWPQMNGEVERQNRSLLKRLTISQNEKGSWKEDLNKYLLMYRSTPHSTTLKTPSELMFNRTIRDKLPAIDRPLELLDEEMRDKDKEMKEKGRAYGDQRRNAKQNEIKKGDKVILKRQTKSNKLATVFEPEIYEVIERKGSELMVENIGNKVQYRRNVAHVKKVDDNNEQLLQQEQLELNQSDETQQATLVPECEKAVRPRSTFRRPASPAPPQIMEKRIRNVPIRFAQFKMHSSRK